MYSYSVPVYLECRTVDCDDAPVAVLYVAAALNIMIALW
eukprot:COSAG03_NODE_26686_length_257_cov_1.291139_1_plen_38_part_01